MNKWNIAHKLNQRLKHIIIPIDVEKAFDKIPHSFLTKSVKKLGIGG
jgi:hypothetical protein